MTTKVVGQSLPRIDALDKVTGRARYPGDFAMPGMLYAKVVWSEQPHARVRRIDTSEAEALPGVVRVITYRDVPVNEYGIMIRDQPVLVAKGQGRVPLVFVGDELLSSGGAISIPDIRRRLEALGCQVRK